MNEYNIRFKKKNKIIIFYVINLWNIWFAYLLTIFHYKVVFFTITNILQSERCLNFLNFSDIKPVNYNYFKNYDDWSPLLHQKKITEKILDCHFDNNLLSKFYYLIGANNDNFQLKTKTLIYDELFSSLNRLSLLVALNEAYVNIKIFYKFNIIEKRGALIQI